jgi:serine/threonine protein kinase
MALNEGSTLGTYEILGSLGAGGMGEVYRARDSKLGRSVAIKVLPEAFAADSDRVPRFEREAKVLASLNHPHIAALYGMEQGAGASAAHFLIMELVEGETLLERLQRGALSRRRGAGDRDPDRRGARICARARGRAPRSETRPTSRSRRTTR